MRRRRCYSGHLSLSSEAHDAHVALWEDRLEDDARKNRTAAQSATLAALAARHGHRQAEQHNGKENGASATDHAMVARRTKRAREAVWSARASCQQHVPRRPRCISAWSLGRSRLDRRGQW